MVVLIANNVLLALIFHFFKAMLLLQFSTVTSQSPTQLIWEEFESNLSIVLQVPSTTSLSPMTYTPNNHQKNTTSRINPVENGRGSLAMILRRSSQELSGDFHTHLFSFFLQFCFITPCGDPLLEKSILVFFLLELICSSCFSKAYPYDWRIFLSRY